MGRKSQRHGKKQRGGAVGAARGRGADVPWEWIARLMSEGHNVAQETRFSDYREVLQQLQDEESVDLSRICVCGTMETPALKLKKCGKCKMVRYCSKECQTKHWHSTHKNTCGHCDPNMRHHTGVKDVLRWFQKALTFHKLHHKERTGQSSAVVQKKLIWHVYKHEDEMYYLKTLTWGEFIDLNKKGRQNINEFLTEHKKLLDRGASVFQLDLKDCNGAVLVMEDTE